MNSWKTLQEERPRYERLATCLSWNTKQDSSRHRVWNIDKLYKVRNMHIKRDKKQHIWDKGEKHTSSSSYIYIYIYQRSTMYVKSHKTKVHVMRTIQQNLTTYLKSTLPYRYFSSLFNNKTTLSYPKLLPLFVTSDRGWIIERTSSQHHT